MFYIVESQSQFTRLKEKYNGRIFAKVFSTSNYFHPKLTSTVAVYIKFIDTEEGFIIPIDHPEGFSNTKEDVQDLLNSFEEIFTVDKKEFFYHFILNNITDLHLLCNINNEPFPEIPLLPAISTNLYNKYKELNIVNKLIPLSKLFEEGENIYQTLKKVINYEKNECFNFYNNLFTKVFFLLEQEGIKIIYQPFLELFKPNHPDFNIENNITYPYYNLYNVTSRPTNSFNSVNFSAIPHKEDFRKAIVPQNDYFIEFDFDGYHLRLLSDIIDYKLDSTKAHRQLASLYFQKEDISDEEYLQAKQMNFQAIYGKIPPQYSDLEIFKKIQTYIDTLWKTFEEQGYVNAPLSMKRFSYKIPDMNPHKLMNYIIQSVETSRNVLILKDVLNFLKDKKTNIALYTYDSIVLDFSKDDGKDLLISIESILSKDNFPVTHKIGRDLRFQL